MISKRDAKRLANDVQERGQEKLSELKDVAGQPCPWMQNNPWAGVGIGAALGLVIGVLISKK